MAAIEQNILKTLGYFDLFQYPLKKEEIFLFHAEEVAPAAIDAALEILANNKLIFRLDEFYSLQSDFLLAERRRKGNLLAVEQMKIAQRVAKFLSKFPFVKGIGVSGSLSKNFASEKTDIDFFIITTANRLWIARTCMHLYKKLTFLTGRQNWFCMNYYVDEAGLEITEKNIFTAMELVTLVPMQGKAGLAGFSAANNWTKKYFPLHNFKNGNTPEIKHSLPGKTVEKIFSGSLGNAADRWLMNITNKRWQKKTNRHRLNSRGISMGMAVGRHFSKPEPKNFQDKVVNSYQAKVEQLLKLSNKAVAIVL